MSHKVHCSELLVIGSGVAGLSVALGIARSRPRARITVVAKEGANVTNTSLAQGGIAAPVGKEDHPEEHARDTLEVGGDAADPSIVRMVTGEAFERIQDLEQEGMPFDRDRDGNLAIGREGGHSKARILRVGDRTGQVLHRTLMERIRETSNIQLLEGSSAMDLIVSEAGCAGAYVVDRKKGELVACWARNTVLATGGTGQVFLRTSNSSIATGDGYAMAERAGLPLQEIGNLQFHPTAFAWEADERAFLISETVRGEGARLKNLEGGSFVEDQDPRGEMAPRALLSRAIAQEMLRSEADHVLLDATHFSDEAFEERFPTIHAHLKLHGIRPSTDPIPVSPAAHYSCGGVPVDRLGWTNMPGLYACGEVAHTGMHGADRTPSNSLLEGLVFAERIRIGVLNDAWPWRGWIMNLEPYREYEDRNERRKAHELRVQLQGLMNEKAGVLASEASLEEAAQGIEALQKEMESGGKKGVPPLLMENRNMLRVAEAIVRDRKSSLRSG